MLAPRPAPISSQGFSNAAFAETISLWLVAPEKGGALAGTVARFTRLAEPVRTRGSWQETFWKKNYSRSYSETASPMLPLTTYWTRWGRKSEDASLRWVARWKRCAVERRLWNQNWLTCRV